MAFVIDSIPSCFRAHRIHSLKEHNRALGGIEVETPVSCLQAVHCPFGQENSKGKNNGKKILESTMTIKVDTYVSEVLNM